MAKFKCKSSKQIRSTSETEIDCLLPTKCYYYYYTFQNDAIHFTTTVIHPMTKQKYIVDINLNKERISFEIVGHLEVYLTIE